MDDRDQRMPPILTSGRTVREVLIRKLEKVSFRSIVEFDRRFVD